MATLPTQARIVIVGGGIVGCSTAYHLAKLGHTDVLLLEQGQLTCGTTWHAAGLVGQMRPNRNMTRMSKYGIELYAQLEAETGLATGWKRCGSVNVAATPERMQVLRRQATLARGFGVEVEVISPLRAGELYPLLRTDDLQGAIWIPGDGKANPADLTAAREVATSDAAVMDSVTDKALRGRAAAVMGEIADQHPTYKTALTEASPQHAGLAERARADDQQRSATKEDRKAFEYASRRDDAANSIADRYATMASAGLTVKDLQGPALDRLDIKDSRDLLLIDGFPPHPRAGESKALVVDSLKSDSYRTTFDRETAEWAISGVSRQPGLPPRTASNEALDQASAASASPADAKQSAKAPPSAERNGTDINTMRSDGDTAERRRAIPPLEDRFNVKRIGLVEKEYHFRDQAGKIAFTDKFMSISTGSASAAAIKAMVDRAAEHGLETVRLSGWSEYVRQGRISATAQGLKAVGHTATAGDREAAAKERARLQVGQDAPAPQKPGETIQRVQSAHVERVSGDRDAAEIRGQRQLAAAIEKALVDGRVSPELRGQVRAMMAAEGARRFSKGQRFKVPVYDSRAPRTRTKSTQTVAHRPGDRERSR